MYSARSIVLMEFLQLYNQLESLVRNEFEIEINESNLIAKDPFLKTLSVFDDFKNNIKIDDTELMITFKNANLNSNTLKVKTWNIHRIFKFSKKYGMLKQYPDTIKSVNKKYEEFSIETCARCLVNTRNKIAHEMSNIIKEEGLKDYEIIESMSNDQLIKNCPEELEMINGEIKNLKNTSKHVLANYIYMKNMLIQLKGKEVI